MKIFGLVITLFILFTIRGVRIATKLTDGLHPFSLRRNVGSVCILPSI